MRLKKLLKRMVNLDYVLLNEGVLDNPILYQVSEIYENHKNLLDRQVIFVNAVLVKQPPFCHEVPVVKVIIKEV